MGFWEVGFYVRLWVGLVSLVFGLLLWFAFVLLLRFVDYYLVLVLGFGFGLFVALGGFVCYWCLLFALRFNLLVV